MAPVVGETHQMAEAISQSARDAIETASVDAQVALRDAIETASVDAQVALREAGQTSDHIRSLEDAVEEATEGRRETGRKLELERQKTTERKTALAMAISEQEEHPPSVGRGQRRRGRAACPGARRRLSGHTGRP